MQSSSRFRIFELFSIEIMTLNRTTKPPIISIVLIEFIMLFCRTVPSVWKVTVCFAVCSVVFCVFGIFFVLFFQNLKIMPTVIEDRRCVTNRSMPIASLLNSEIPDCSDYEEWA